jgi:hypothetical protein
MEQKFVLVRVVCGKIQTNWTSPYPNPSSTSFGHTFLLWLQWYLTLLAFTDEKLHLTGYFPFTQNLG